ncbi:urease accessory protein UreE [Arthrobacter crystallopoietes]|uniref:urease accessory protein UreE n=1 Tax=Crystallibacter crystallopoietes TaxID=37928 RepID=UPI0011112331|nr:urease accessory protein UreE [Arthrobacter crystallopoietes]QTG81927.1 urease accessory protein UreE [Arthrobacter crystallopoietes]
MIVDRVIGNRHELPAAELAGLHEEKVILPSAELVKRIQRVTTDHGRDVGIRLSTPGDLRDGDILHRDERNVIVISVLPTDVLVIAPRSIQEMGTVAHNLGNRHMQAQFFDTESDYRAEVMVVQYDHTIEDFLRHAQVPYSRQERVMPVPFRHAEHTH